MKPRFRLHAKQTFDGKWWWMMRNHKGKDWMAYSTSWEATPERAIAMAAMLPVPHG